MRRLLLALLLLVGTPATAATVTVAAASDLRYAMDELVRTYRQTSSDDIKVSFGSSGVFHQQIQRGAPFQLFLSADESYVLSLHKAGRTRDRGTLYAIGRLVLFAPRGSPLAGDPTLAGLKSALAAGRIRRLAIANPDHAPYGARARDVLQATALWDRLQQRLVLGENVSQALQFATTGGADGGIVALSLVKAPGFARLGNWSLVPENLHRPLRQRMVLTRQSSVQAVAFYQWLQGPEARAILARYGFATTEPTP